MVEQQTQKRGRKPLVTGQRMVQRMITIDENTAQVLIDAGDGNLSAGIRRAAEIVQQSNCCEKTTFVTSNEHA